MAKTSFKIVTPIQKAGLVLGLLALLGCNYFFGKWALANMASSHAEMIEVAELSRQLGPSDPLTHYASAVLYERSFLPADFDRSLREYETAAALAPNNYLFWLGLGNARSRSGDLPGAERALTTAEELAPNYSVVNWALGNVLLREGKTAEAFPKIMKASAANPEYAPAGAVIAWQYSDKDVGRLRAATGDSPLILASLVKVLADQKELDAALTVWNSLPADMRRTTDVQQDGIALSNALLAAKRFRDSSKVCGDMESGRSISVGKIANGNFEDEIRPQASNVFQWTIADGTSPQIAPTDGQKHGGSRSLVVIFGQNATNDFRQVSQTVAVQPGKQYDLHIEYKGDIQTSGSIHWEIADASDGKTLTQIEKIVSRADWTSLAGVVEVPQTADGIVLRLVKNCPAPSCGVSGKVWFDDIVLTEK